MKGCLATDVQHGSQGHNCMLNIRLKEGDEDS